jgi:hypothetical protein
VTVSRLSKHPERGAGRIPATLTQNRKHTVRIPQCVQRNIASFCKDLDAACISTAERRTLCPIADSNGLSVSRALTSENVSRVELASGAGALGVASTSNLGGVIETYSSDPSKMLGLDLRETGGSYSTTRTFARFDTGEFAGGNSAYISYLHHDARAWDFDGHQRGDQVFRTPARSSIPTTMRLSRT